MARQQITIVGFILLLFLGISRTESSDAGIGAATACLMTGENIRTSENTLVHLNRNYASVQNIALRHWDRPHITIALVGSDGSRPTAQARALVQDAARLWNDQVQTTVEATLTDGSNGDITIAFVPMSTLPANVVGRTTVNYRLNSGTLCHAAIVVQEGLTSDKCLQAVAHELGHALGIQGHSPDGTDLMFDKAHYPAAVTTADANTLRIGYPSVAPGSLKQ